MAIRHSGSHRSSRSNSSKQQVDNRRRQNARHQVRRMLTEQLEQRQLLAVGPQLIGIQPNNSDLLFDGNVRNTAPRELVFRFDDVQRIDPATLGGIRLTAAGGDGSFGRFTAESDFGSNGAASIELTSIAEGQSLTVAVNHAVLAPGALPTISAAGNNITVTLNTRTNSRTTAEQLVQTINNSPVLNGRLIAKVKGGLQAATLGHAASTSYSPILVNQTRDLVVQPGAVLVGQNPDENEVTVRFAETLKDDLYRIEIFGFDDPTQGVVGLRNLSDQPGVPGQLYRPSLAGTRKDTIQFRLDLGPQVTAVVPQPVYRVGTALQQQRDTIVVYFDNDKLLVENDSQGNPTSRSVENPQFYQLLYTNDTVRNTDDQRFLPQSVRYNALTNTATLRFASDLNELTGAGGGGGSFRLRIGTRETLPMAPSRLDAAATILTDLNTDNAVQLRFTARQAGEQGNGIRVQFVNSGSGTPVASVAGRIVTIDMGRNNLTLGELVTLVQGSPTVSALISVDVLSGPLTTVVGDTNLAFSPLTLVGVGGTFDTAMDLGQIGSQNTPLTSLILSSAIEASPFRLDLAGASNDAAHPIQLQGDANTPGKHVNNRFGADSTDGITTIYYNFRNIYSTDASNTPLTNAITDQQKQRAREVLGLWSKYIGVQFIETESLGLTIASGSFSGLRVLPGTQVQFQSGLGYGVRIDPTFQNPMVVMSVSNEWGNLYGESFTRTMAAAMGQVLGLTSASDLPSSELMRLDPLFLAGNDPLVDGNDAQLNANDERFEPVFPGNQDILHGRFLHRPDSSDIDLYRLEVDFGGQDRVGILVAETYAQRLANSSDLDTYLQLYRQVNASAETTFNVNGLNVRFESLRPGAQGNQFQIFFTQSELGVGGLPTIQVFPNAISIDLNASIGQESTVQEVLDAIANSSLASSLVRATVLSGDVQASIGRNIISQNPVRLLGGQFELIAQNDDYFSRDSMIRQTLPSGVYYIGVSASGNDKYNASIADSGFGGRSQGNYELRVNYRAAVDPTDTIQDMAGQFSGDRPIGLDGNGDGQPGGTNDFWFQTRPLNRSLAFNAGANPGLEGRTVTVIGANGTQRVFEFSADANIAPGRVRIPYSAGTTAAGLSSALATAINSRSELGVTATASGIRMFLVGERSIAIDPALTLIDVSGRTIFVDKAAGPNADGSLSRPFNNISGSGVANAFASTHPGDIVRIVGNGGTDNNLTSVNNNFAYEIGRGLMAGSILSDGISMDVPRGVTTVIDAGAIFKLRGAAIQAGSSNLNIDRSGAILQVLGTPMLLDADGNPVRTASGGLASGQVSFTSWLDETTGLDNYTPTTTPGRGDWGGILLRRDVDAAAGRKDLEDEGIFLRTINFADIRFGGGIVNLDSVQQVVNPIDILGNRPNITNNRIRFSSSAAISADPSALEETNFNEPRYQINGQFTSDYDRVGPNIRGNILTNNSVNGLFIKVATPADGVTRTLTVPGRMNDTDIVHVISESLIVTGAVGGSLLDNTTPQAEAISLGANVGGTLNPGIYNYKMTFVDRNGYESVPSNASVSIELLANQTAINLAGLPGATGDFVARRLYRSAPGGQGPYSLVAILDRLSSTFLDIGQNPGGTLSRDRLDVNPVTLSEQAVGTLPQGTYDYRIVPVDSSGREGLASNATASLTTSADNLAIQLEQIPAAGPGVTAKRIYRSGPTGGSGYVLVGELAGSSASATTFLDTGAAGSTPLAAETLGVKRPRLAASLVVDPGMVVKLEASRIEAQMGTNLIIEGVDGLPIHFTSRADDTIGAGGTFDTNDNNSQTAPVARDWGGIYMAPTSRLSIDHGRFSYGGGVTRMDGTFRAFNTIEIQQAEARIANSLFENNANGMGGQGPGTRLGRLSNSPSTIFVRGAQPLILDNTFRDNVGSAIRIDVNSMIDSLITDTGRQTGDADRSQDYLANRGPLIRGNRMQDNSLNGLEIRGGTLTVGSVWDDTDIAHVIFQPIFTGNIQHSGGLRLQSSPTESLVVKFDGYGSNFNRNLGAGITANGQMTTAIDRVGGTLHVVGQPGFPVILTSLKDDTVGAGLQPDGSPQTDTNNDGINSIPQAADWRGILIDQFSNDRNVALVLELEDSRAAAPGPNSSTTTAQVLGDLAGNASSSSENLRLGFVVEGVLSQPEDVDVYSFTGVAGSEVWLDVDYTDHSLDLVLELLDANGNLLARSTSSTAESDDPSLLVTSGSMPVGSVNPLNVRQGQIRRTSGGLVKEDGTTNLKDPGMRVRLPGSSGARSTFYFRLRSAGQDIDDVGAGLSAGAYQVQVRLREAQEWAGSTVNYADIRYAMNGVRLRGMPGESPLMGEVMEDESVGRGQFTANNGVATGNGVTTSNFFFGSGPEKGNRPQYIGNIASTAKGAISVAGTLSTGSDVDFYMFDVQSSEGLFGGHTPVVFDIDYADGINRPDVSINIFRQETSNFQFNSSFPDPFQQNFQYRLVYSSTGSNLADDQPRPLAGNDMSDLSRGSAGTRDAFIGPIALPEGTYLVAVTSAAMQPRTRVLNPSSVEPINSIRRIVDERHQAGVTTADPPEVPNFLPQTQIGPGGEIVSNPFNLGRYAAADEPVVYLDYTKPAGTFQVFVRNSAGVETLIANNAALPAGAGQRARIPLSASTYDFAGQDDLRLIFRGTNAQTTLNNVIIGFAERGESVGVGDEPILLDFGFLFGPFASQSTRTFSLATYLAGRENPQLSLAYEIFEGEMDIFVVGPGGATRVATSVDDDIVPGSGEELLVVGGLQSVLIDMNRWANQPGLTVVFQMRDAETSSALVQNVHIQLADGSRVMTGETNSTFVPVNVPSTTITSGAYQLEVRLGDNYFESQAFGSPLLTRSFDTNDRLADAVSIVAPRGADITAGDRFSISDGGSVVVFEFTQNGSVGLGNVAVLFNPADPNFVVARAIRNAINSSGVQSRLQVRAATSSGVVSGNAGRDPKLNLFGNAIVRTVQAANAAAEVQVVFSQGRSDRNVTREQGQVLIQNSFIRQSRDYSVWSEPAARLQDPRDVVQLGSFVNFYLQDVPNIVGTQAARNLLVANNSVQGGLLPGVVIQNNVLEEGGLGGINISGENPIWMISPLFVPFFPEGDDPDTWNADYNPLVNSSDPPSHFGFYLDDGDQLIIDSDRTRLRFEFEDMAGGGTGNPVWGSGQVEGNGYLPDSSVAWYRDTGGDLYQRTPCDGCQPFATNAFETMHALRDSILGSILVTNGTTQIVNATIAESLMGPDVNAPPTGFGFGYPLYHNRPALYLEGVTNIQYFNLIPTPGNPFDIRTLDLGHAPQPHTRIVNNTVVGKDGRASFNGESPLNEANDSIANAVQTWQGTSIKPLVYSDVGVIGDGGPIIAGDLPASSGNSGSSSGDGGGQGGGGNATASFRPQRVIVRFEDHVTEQQQNQFLAARGLEVDKRFSLINGVLARVPDNRPIISLAAELTNTPQVKYAEPDYEISLTRAPNDPRYPQQWALNNTGQTGGTPGADIGAERAWDIFTGSSEVVIAVLDTGVDFNHPDLRNNMWVNPGELVGNTLDDDGNGYVNDIHGWDFADGDSDPMDVDGHGTHVAGTIAAATNNAIGIAGVAWNSKIMALKIFNNFGTGFSSGSIEAIQYMTRMKTLFGINIVASNNSYGRLGDFSQAERDAIEQSINAGILFVASAGNDTNNNDVLPAFPASYGLDGIISVAATNHNDVLAGFSNFGASRVDLAAPGVDILSTLPGGGYGLLSGTSMAAPHVAGVAALLAGLNPELSVNELKAAILLGADPVDSLKGTSVTGARLNAHKSLLVSSVPARTSTDVDIFQFKLGTGERAFIDVATENSGLQAALQIFDSRGVPQRFVNFQGNEVLITGTEGPDGSWSGRDPSADFTALKPGVYYAAVSSVGNTTYDPLSLAGRTRGTSSGAYRISIDARTLNDFVIVAQDASAYQTGQTFTIHGVPDSDVSGSTGVTFEFIIGPGDPSNPVHIPINLGPDWRFPDVARAIAKAINEGDFGRPAVSNRQQLPNGRFGTASPLPAAHAQGLGGLDGVLDAPRNTIVGDLRDLLEQLGNVDELGTNVVPQREIERQITGPVNQSNQGLRLFPRRPDGVTTVINTGVVSRGRVHTHTQFTSLSHLGIGHDRLSTTPLSPTSLADGTTEKFIVVKNVAFIDGNGSILVAPDLETQNNLNQLLPETGVLATRGASPTILNNVFFNVQTPVINEESRRFPITGVMAPYGSNNPNFPVKPGQVTLGGSIYQYHETATSINRFATGIESSPTNVPNTSLDFNTIVPATTRLFVNAQAGNYVPAAGSPLVDSAIDTLPERPALATVKTAMGLSVSPIVTPSFDIVGQLRTDDPDVAPPQGQGQNIFKDRGAFDRADFIGPAAILLKPIDNDALAVDRDPADSVVQLVSGVYPEFRIQLKDGNEPANPLFGLGIDDSSVTGTVVPDLRALGAAVVVTENGRMLVEGIDYRFAYNETRDEIILTPLAGVWQNGKVYEITVNNRDRFVVSAPAGGQVSDGDTFSIVDNDGGVVVFEFDSGYRLQVPQNLTLQVPLAGTTFGGIVDGERFTVITNLGPTTFEFDTNGNVLAGNRAISLSVGASQQSVVQAILSAINGSQLGISATDLGAGEIGLGADSGVRLDTGATIVDQPRSTLAFAIPENALRGILRDGQSFRLSDGRRQATFEFDTDGNVVTGNIPIDFSAAGSIREVALLMQLAIQDSPVNLNPTILANDLLYLGLPDEGSVDVGTAPLTVVGASRTVQDGQTMIVRNGGQTVTFEFTRDASVAQGRVPITVSATDSQNQIAARIVQAIENANIGLQPRLVGSGNIIIGGNSDTEIDISGAPSMGLFGRPGIQSSTQLELFGPLLVQVPLGGASGIVENSTFSVTSNGRTVVFEFDSNFSGPSQPGNAIVRYTATSTANEIAQAIVVAITQANLGLTPQVLGAGRISLGRVASSTFSPGSSSLVASRGLVADGERFSITLGDRTVQFEFDDVTLSNGVSSGNVAILFSPNSTVQSILSSMRAAINSAGLELDSQILAGSRLQLNDTPRHSIDTSLAPTLVRSGVPGGTNRVPFLPDAIFTSEDMKWAMIDAINSAFGTNLSATNRGGNTLLVSNAISVSQEMDSFFVRGVVDLAGNFLKPNQVDGETRFTILMPEVELNFGDAPDPVGGALGRYPTLFVNNGARHVVTDRALLGSSISTSPDGRPSLDASSDPSDDGVVFGTNYLIQGLFNPHIQTPVTVTMSSPGFLDAWFDWNFDGDWDDPGEYQFQSVRFTADNLTQTFMVTVPASAAVPTTLTNSFARFRTSTRGSLSPTGLAVDGEVEDYRIIMAPGTPPTAVNSNYSVNEDAQIITTDANGQSTPNFTPDDGVAANDISPDGRTLGVELITGPTNAQFFELRSDGTFTYRPNAHFWGTDQFTYRVNDGILNSNNIGTVTITVAEVNDPPVVNGDTFATNENTSLAINVAQVLANDSPGPNEANQTITVTGVQTTSAAGGTVSLVAGVITYTPAPSFSGTDTFTYTVTDNGTTLGVPAPLSSVGTITITVIEVNDPPVPGPFTSQVQENRPAAPSLLEINTQQLVNLAVAGPVDEQAWQAIRFVGVNPISQNGGSVTWDPVANIVRFIPQLHFSGTDLFFYEIEDFSTDSNRPVQSSRAIGTVTVTVINVNDPPFVETPLTTVVMAEDSANRVIDLGQFFSDPDIALAGDSLIYRVVSNSRSSLVNPTVANNLLTLQLMPDQNGQSLIVIEAEDQAGLTVRDTLTLSVTPVNDAPRLANPLPSVNVNKNSVVPGISLSPTYFFDPDVLTNGDVLTYSIVSNTNPLLVTPTIVSGVLNLSLLPNQFGVAVITMSATDTAGLSVSSALTLTVNDVNQPPTAQGDAYSVAQGTTLTVPASQGVLANDTDPEGATLTAVLVAGPQAASQFNLNANGSFTYRHNGVNRQTDSFTYQAFDGQGFSQTVTVTITIDPPPPSSHQNQAMNLDVNADGRISSIDALLIINVLNSRSSPIRVQDLPAPPPFVDVNGDYRVSALDALLVINELNMRSSGGGTGGGGEGEAEGEGVSDASSWQAAPAIHVLPTSDNRSYGLQDVPEESSLDCSAALLDGSKVQPASSHWVDLSWIEERSMKLSSERPLDTALSELMDESERLF